MFYVTKRLLVKQGVFRTANNQDEREVEPSGALVLPLTKIVNLVLAGFRCLALYLAVKRSFHERECLNTSDNCMLENQRIIQNVILAFLAPNAAITILKNACLLKC